MSDIVKGSDPKFQLENKKFWANKTHWAVYRLFKEGKSVKDISDKLSMKPFWVEETVASPYFIKKLEHYIAAELFGFQVGRLVALEDMFSKLWNKVSNNMDKLAPEAALVALMKILPGKTEATSPRVINPKQFNLFVNLLGKLDDPNSGDSPKDLAESFGYKPLKLPTDADANEKSTINLKLDPRGGNQNK